MKNTFSILQARARRGRRVCSQRGLPQEIDRITSTQNLYARIIEAQPGFESRHDRMTKFAPKTELECERRHGGFVLLLLKVSIHP